MQTIEHMDYAQLKSLRDDIDGLMAKRREEALTELKAKAAALDFPIDTVFAAMNGKAPKYGDGQGNYYGGKGKRPQWLKDALDNGATLEDFKL